MADLEKRTLGRTGMDVTVLGYGAMELRGAPRGREISEDETGKAAERSPGPWHQFHRHLHRLRSERGAHRAAHIEPPQRILPRQQNAVALSAGSPSRGRIAAAPHVYTKENITAGVEQSLRRLRTDHLDLLQVHMTPSRAVLEENNVIETMRELRQQGKIRFLGMSGTIPNLTDHIAMDAFDAFQIPYSASQREHEALVMEAAEAGAGTIIRGGAAHGAPSKAERPAQRNPELLDVWEQAKLDELLEEGQSRMEFVIRFTETHPGMSTNIVGTINADHLAANLEAAAKGNLPADVYEEAKRRLEAAGTAP